MLRAPAVGLAVLGLLLGATRAQIAPGDPAPAVAVDRAFNLEPRVRQLSELRGPALLIEYWQTWCAPCRAQVPTLNALHEKYRERGLVVVGVTDEDPAKVAAFVEALDVQYPIAVERSAASRNAFGVRAFPTAFLVDPSGDVVWRGHPAQLQEATIEAALADAVPPFVRLPEPLLPVQTLLDKGRLGKAREMLRALLATHLPARSARIAQIALDDIEREARARLERAEDAVRRADWCAAWPELQTLAEQFAGMDASAAARQRLQALRREPAVARELDAASALQAARALADEGKAEAARAARDALARHYAGTQAAALAGEGRRRYPRRTRQWLLPSPMCAASGIITTS